MQNAQAGRVFAVIAGIFAVLSALAAMRSGFAFAKHETDMLHLVDIVLRLAGGAKIHADVMTPLGHWAFAPFAFLHEAGMGLGASLKWGQIGVAGLLILPVWWTAVSRFENTAVGAAFGAAVLVLVAGLVYGGHDPKISLSMHYNRWAWAIAFLPLALAVLPSLRRNALADAAVIGAAMAALVMIKATYFVAFAPVVVLGLLMRREAKTLGLAVLIGLGILAVQTAFAGISFWQGYIGDLLSVASSPVRPQPGHSLAQVVLSPAYVWGTALALGSALWLRKQGGDDPAPVLLLLLLPASIYVTYQNYGNDPLWLVLWAFLLFQIGQQMAHVMPKVMAVLALALIAGTATNIALSPVRAVTQPAAVFEPLLAEHPDLRGVGARFEGAAGRFALGSEDPQCTLVGGAVENMREMTARLEAAGLQGEAVYAAGLFNTFWLMGDFEPVSGAAPWNYGGLPGIENASVLAVPECSIQPQTKELVMRELTEAGYRLEPLYQDELIAAFRLQAPK